MAAPENKFCVDCKKIGWGNSCQRKAPRYDLVTGYALYVDARVERSSRWPWRCGPTGKYFVCKYLTEQQGDKDE